MLSRCGERMRAGDWVAAYVGFENVKAIQLQPGEVIFNKNGSFKHDDFIDKPFGSRIYSSEKPRKGGNATNTSIGRDLSQSSLLALKLTPSLWTDVLNHRTQILFQTDIALVLYHLNLRPGSVVVESGTGSGSLTTSLAHCIAPFGHVHTFEYNIERVKKAKTDFANTGIDHLVSVYHRDVCGKGFPRFAGGIDAAFLDLPNPWVVIDSINLSLKPQGIICSFSPCIEQVQRTCIRLTELGYESIHNIEVLLNTVESHMQKLNVFDFDAPAPTRPGSVKPSPSASPVPAEEEQQQLENQTTTDSNENRPVKRARSDGTEDAGAVVGTASPTPVHVAAPPVIGLCSKRPTRMRGHTGYLTFARKPASFVELQ